MGSCLDSRTELRVAWPSHVEGTWVPSVHANCPHNEVAALVRRSFGPLPKPVDAPLGAGVSAEFARLARFARRYSGHKWGLLETAHSYSGSMRRRYIEAERSLKVDGWLTSNDVYLRAFLKVEKHNAMAKFQKPRLIYPRSPRYNLVLASRLKPFEHWLWGRLTARELFGGSRTRVVMKGLTPRERANQLVRKFESLDSCVVFEADAKAFEAHVGTAQLRGEHDIYHAAYPGDRVLRGLLREQLGLRGQTASGVKFSREGGRASGDFNTGMGNSLIMLAVVVGALRSYNIPFDVAVDGDNALVFLRGRDASRVLCDFSSVVLANSGHELELESPVDYIEGMRFGNSHPVKLLPSSDGWVMVRDWRRVLSGASASHRWLREPAFAREWLTGVAMCELSLARGVPVLQAWALELLKAMGGSRDVRAHPHVEYFMVGASFAREQDAKVVSPETRVSFERAFGMPPDVQQLVEAGLHCPRSLDFVTVPTPLFGTSFESGHGDFYLDERI